MRITRSAHNIPGSFIWHQKQTVTLAVGCSKALIMFLLPTAFIKCQFGKWCRCFTFIVITIIILFIFLTIYLINYDISPKKKVFKCPDQSRSQNSKLFGVQTCHAIWVSMHHSYKKIQMLLSVTVERCC